MLIGALMLCVGPAGAQGTDRPEISRRCAEWVATKAGAAFSGAALDALIEAHCTQPFDVVTAQREDRRDARLGAERRREAAARDRAASAAD